MRSACANAFEKQEFAVPCPWWDHQLDRVPSVLQVRAGSVAVLSKRLGSSAEQSAEQRDGREVQLPTGFINPGDKDEATDPAPIPHVRFLRTNYSREQLRRLQKCR